MEKLRLGLTLAVVAACTALVWEVAHPFARGPRMTAEPVAEPRNSSGEPIGELEIGATENESERSLPHQRVQAERLPVNPKQTFLAGASSLDLFYRAMASRLRGEPSKIRIAHYGDSLITSDFLSGTARRLLQDRFGEGGHGFVAIANPWEWYFHNDVAHVATSGWRQSRVSGPLIKDGSYGPGGVVFRGSAGASAHFGTAKDGDYGRKVSEFHVLYAARPGGGSFELKTASETRVIDTDASEEHPALVTLSVPEAEGKLGIRVLRGEAKLYGVALERDAGIVYDAMGVLGARAKMWDQLAEQHWREIYALRPPTLVAIQYGTNEIESGGVDPAEYTEMLTNLVRKWRRAAPDSSFVLVGPPDMAERLPKNAGFRSNRALARLNGIQREVAGREGIAFFDTIAAMGGDGAMVKWLMAHPPLCSTDLIHPTPAGGDMLGQLFVRGLLGGYAEWQAQHADQPTL